MPKCFLSKDTKQLNKVFRNIIGERELQGISQTQMGEELGISQQAYSRIEKKKSMNIEQFLEVCKVLNVNPGEMFE